MNESKHSSLDSSDADFPYFPRNHAMLSHN